MGLSRSLQMARIRGRDTRPELIVRRELALLDVRFRTNFKTLGGRADIAIPKARIAIFIDGCFWHGCPVHYVRPRSRDEFWSDKLRENVARDVRQTRLLKQAGWIVWRAWEHEVHQAPARVAEEIQQLIQGKVRRRVGWRVLIAQPSDSSGNEEWRLLVDLSLRRTPRLVKVKRSTKKWPRPRH